MRARVTVRVRGRVRVTSGLVLDARDTCGRNDYVPDRGGRVALRSQRRVHHRARDEEVRDNHSGGAGLTSAGGREPSCCATSSRLMTRKLREKSLTRSALARFSTRSSLFRSGLSLPRTVYSVDT